MATLLGRRLSFRGRGARIVPQARKRAVLPISHAVGDKRMRALGKYQITVTPYPFPYFQSRPWPRTRKYPHSPRLSGKKYESSACHNFGVRAPNKKHKKCLVGSEPWLRPAEFLGFGPRGELKRRPLAYLTGRQPVTPVDGARSGSRGRRLVTAAPGRLRASSGRHYDRSGRCIPGLGQAGAGNARGRARGLSAPVG